MPESVKNYRLAWIPNATQHGVWCLLNTFQWINDDFCQPHSFKLHAQGCFLYFSNKVVHKCPETKDKNQRHMWISDRRQCKTGLWAGLWHVTGQGLNVVPASPWLAIMGKYLNRFVPSFLNHKTRIIVPTSQVNLLVNINYMQLLMC